MLMPFDFNRPYKQLKRNYYDAVTKHLASGCELLDLKCD